MEGVEAAEIIVPDAPKEGLEVMAILEQRPYDVMEREFQQACSHWTLMALRFTRVQCRIRSAARPANTASRANRCWISSAPTGGWTASVANTKSCCALCANHMVRMH